MSDITPPRVFISYSHDSDTHADRIRTLSDRLRSNGIDCHIDQYVAGPREGWPMGMDRQIEESDFVLVVFTERYTQKSKEGRQSGVRFESVLILQDLYEAGMINDKFIPVLFDKSDGTHVVRWLKPYNHYVVSEDDGYETLRRRLLNDPAIVMPPLGIPAKKGPANPWPPRHTRKMWRGRSSQGLTLSVQTLSLRRTDCCCVIWSGRWSPVN